MPTFIKTGYWDKLVKAPKGFLNLEDLIASYVGSGLPGQVGIWGASGLGGSSNLVWDGANNRLGINNSTPLFSADITGTARITGATLISPVSTINTYNYFSSFNVVNNGPASIAVDRFSNNVTSPHFNLRKSRGTTTAPLIVQTNDELGYVGFWGHDGTNFQRNGIILTQAFNVTGTTITPVMRFGVGVNAGSNQYHISLHNTGNTIFGPDSTADTGQKVQVIGNVFIKGSGATSATTALTVQNSAGTDYLGVRNDGLLYSRGTNFWFSAETTLSSIANGSFITGYRNVATGNYSFAANGGRAGIGGRNQALGDFSAAFGRQAIAYHAGQFSHSSFGFNLEGSSQHSFLQLNRDVTGTAITQLFIDGSTAQATLPVANSMWNAKIYVLAVCTTAGGTTVLGDVFSGEYLACIKRVGATTSMVGSISTDEKSNTSMSTSIVTIDADTATNALRIRFTPPTTSAAGTAIRVVATLHLTEVRY